MGVGKQGTRRREGATKETVGEGGGLEKKGEFWSRGRIGEEGGRLEKKGESWR